MNCRKNLNFLTEWNSESWPRVLGGAKRCLWPIKFPGTSMTQLLLCGANRLKAAPNPRHSAVVIPFTSLASFLRLFCTATGCYGDASAATLWELYNQILIASQLIWLVSSKKNYPLPFIFVILYRKKNKISERITYCTIPKKQTHLVTKCLVLFMSYSLIFI